jgi:DNA-binding NtrC family response regulator
VSTAVDGSPVLVVDDELLIRWALAQALGDAGYRVREATSGKGALSELEHEPRPSVVLLDYCLPDVEDLGLLSGIVARAPGVPVILMTAFGTRELPGEALARGAYAFLHKPFDLGTVVALVGHASATRTH